MNERENKTLSDPYRVLLVEDLDGDAILFERAIRQVEGFQVACRVRNGHHAIKYLKGEGEFADRKRYPFPDIMMLDLKLPECDGFEVLQWAQRRSPRPIIAVFSELDGEPTRRRAEQLGADLFENKIWHPPAFGRFLHFCGNMANVRTGRKRLGPREEDSKDSDAPAG